MKRLIWLFTLCCLLVTTGAAPTVARINDSGLIPIGGLVYDILPDPARPLLYIADYDNSRVLFMHTPSGRIIAEVPTGAGPISLAIDPGGKRLYVAEHWLGTIGVIDIRSATRIAGASVGARPRSIAAGRPGRLYVTTITTPPGWSPYGDLRIFDTTTGEMMGPFFDMGFYDPRAAMGRDNNTLYVLLTGLSPGYLDAIDVSTDDPVVSVGIYTASYVHDLWVNWRGDKLYIDGAAYDLPALTPAGMIPVTATTATTIPSDSMIITGDWRYPIIYAWDADLLTEIDHIETVGGANLVRMSPHNRVLSAVIWGDNVELFWYTPGP